MTMHSEKFRVNYQQVKNAIARQDRAAEERRDALDRAAVRTPPGALTTGDIAVIVADIVKDQKRDILAHVERRLKLIALDKPAEDLRDHNLHRRVTQIESELRLMKKAKSR